MIFFVESLNLTTLRKAEFGFFGLLTKTLKQIPFRCGEPARAGFLHLKSFFLRVEDFLHN